MLLDSFWFNLLVFAAGQAIAGWLLATGCVLRGAVMMIGLLVLADVALVARFAYVAWTPSAVALVGMQTWVVVEAVLCSYQRWQRARPLQRERRRLQLAQALRCELSDRPAEAVRIYRALARRDPWDLQAVAAAASVCRRLGRRRSARWLRRRARALDRRREYHDYLRLEARREAGQPPRSAGAGAAGGRLSADGVRRRRTRVSLR